jgi:hypothetical protein
MIDLSENLQDNRKEAPPTHIGMTTENVVREFPMRWLDEVDQHGNFVPHFDSTAHHFGIGIYKDGSISCGFQIDATDPQFLSQPAADITHNNLQAALTAVEKGDNLHFLWNTIDEDQTTLSIYEHDRDGLETHPIQAKIRKDTLENVKARLQTGELKSIRAYCFLNLPYETKEHKAPRNAKASNTLGDHLFSNFKSLSAAITNLGSLTRTRTEEVELQHLHERIQIAIRKLKSYMNAMATCPGVSVKPANAADYTRLLYRIWSPSHWQREKLEGSIDLQSLFRNSIYSFPQFVVQDDIKDTWGWQFKTGKHYHRILSLRIQPEHADIGWMVGCMGQQENNEIYNSQYSLIVKPANASESYQALAKQLKYFTGLYRHDPQNNKNVKAYIEDIESQLEKLSRSEGSFVFSVVLMVHIWHENTSILTEWENSLCRAFSVPPLKAKISIEQLNSLPYCLTNFTPGFTRDPDDYRKFIYRSVELATHIPLMGASDGFVQVKPTGRRSPRLFETHRNTLFAQYDFARGRVNSWGGASVGVMGSGKSMYYNMKVAALLSPLNKVIIIDAAQSPSFRALCSLLNGNLNQISLRDTEKCVCTNPLFTEFLPNGHFRNPSPDEIVRITNIIEPMVRRSHTEQLNNFERSCLSNAISMAFDHRKTSEGRVYLRMVADALTDISRSDRSSINQRVYDMATQLRNQWCWPNGPYQYFVDGDSTRTRENDLTVYELQGLDETPDLKAVMAATYFNHIQTISARNQTEEADALSTITVIADEVANLLLDPVMAKSFSNLSRKQRAQNVSLHNLTQFMSDFEKLVIYSDPKSGTSTIDTESNDILGNTTWYQLFKHAPGDVESTKRLLQLTDDQAQELASLETIPGQARQMIQYTRLINGNAFNKLLIRPTRFELCAFSSDAEDRARKNTVRNRLEREWVESTNRRTHRESAVNRLENLGFQEADTLRDEQLLELLTIIECQ